MNFSTMRAKKSLGQNFLNSTKIVGNIVDASEIGPNDTVLEIGPGKGILTQKLLENAGQVIAIEKDDRLIELLQQIFKVELETGKLVLIHADVLEIDLQALPCETYTLVANIPYYITGAVIQKFLESDKQPLSMTLMVQKEIADRIIARDKKESILSMSIKAYGKPKKIMKVPARYFSPAPKVDSAILVIADISKDFFTEITEDQFFKIMKRGFAHKRKLLINNLELLCPKKDLVHVFDSCNVPKTARAENLDQTAWKCIVKALHDREQV